LWRRSGSCAPRHTASSRPTFSPNSAPPLWSDRDARALLSDALTLADACGARSLGNAIAWRLGSAPHLQRRRLDALDARRERVARLAADGHSESEIAYSMVLGLDTVTTLLREAHDALGAGSLAELRRALTP
jgi:DNA-binding NarL/FixJ family response regulator